MWCNKLVHVNSCCWRQRQQAFCASWSFVLCGKWHLQNNIIFNLIVTAQPNLNLPGDAKNLHQHFVTAHPTKPNILAEFLQSNLIWACRGMQAILINIFSQPIQPQPNILVSIKVSIKGSIMVSIMVSIKVTIMVSIQGSIIVSIKVMWGLLWWVLRWVLW